MNFKIETIPHNAQRYDTVGDYFYKHINEIIIRVSDFSAAVAHSNAMLSTEEVKAAEKMEFCVMIHEFVESFLCHQDNIKTSDIDKWDLDHLDDEDPGSNPEAPYHTQHMFATEVEKLMCSILGLDWDEYDRAVRSFTSKEQEKSEA
ncbi:MAG TPA: hypothetical protein VII99_10580 [Bacteroidia bacterium]